MAGKKPKPSKIFPPQAQSLPNTPGQPYNIQITNHPAADGGNTSGIAVTLLVVLISGLAGVGALLWSDLKSDIHNLEEQVRDLRQSTASSSPSRSSQSNQKNSTPRP